MYKQWKTVPAIAASLVALGLIVGTLTAAKPPAPPSIKYSLTLLEPLVSGLPSGTGSINESGDIVGSAAVSPDPNDWSHACMWPAGTATPVDLNILLPSDWLDAGWLLTSACDINRYGQIVGSMTRYNPYEDRTFRYTPSTGEFENLGEFYVSGINDSGDVAGDYVRTVIVDGKEFTTWQGVLYTNESGVIRIDDSPYGSWSPTGINNRKDLGGGVFQIQIAGTSGAHAVRYTYKSGGGSFFTSLGVIKSFRGDSSSYASGINDSGQVTGRSIAGGFQWNAFLYSDATGMKDLGTLGGSQSLGTAINALGDVVGLSETNSRNIFHAFLYTKATGMIDLTAAIVNLPPGFVGRVGTSRINTSQSVCGQLNPDSGYGPPQAILLTRIQ